MLTEFEAFVTGLVIGGILGVWEAIAKIVALASGIAVTLAVMQTVSEESLSVTDAIRYWFTYLFSAAHYYWPAVIGFTVGMFTGALVRRRQ